MRWPPFPAVIGRKAYVDREVEHDTGILEHVRKAREHRAAATKRGSQRMQRRPGSSHLGPASAAWRQGCDTITASFPCCPRGDRIPDLLPISRQGPSRVSATL